MVPHRTLELDAFIESINPDLVRRFLGTLASPDSATEWATINGKGFEEFFESPSHAEHKPAAYENLARMNDLCDERASHLTRAYQRFGLPYDQMAPYPRLAMILYLDHPEAFEWASSFYALFGNTTMASWHRFDPELVMIDAAALGAFRDEVAEAFVSWAKGRACRVHHAASDDGVVLRVEHGSYLRTLPYFEEEQEAERRFIRLRPAKEDLLYFEFSTGALVIRTGSERERDVYLRCFARYMAHDEALAVTSARAPRFSLAPLHLGVFKYQGDGAEVLDVAVRLLEMRCTAGDEIIQQFRGNVLSYMATNPHGLSMASGDLRLARLKFTLWPAGTTKAVVATATVRPPDRIGIKPSRYEPLVLRFLDSQGVRLP